MTNPHELHRDKSLRIRARVRKLLKEGRLSKRKIAKAVSCNLSVVYEVAKIVCSPPETSLLVPKGTELLIIDGHEFVTCASCKKKAV